MAAQTSASAFNRKAAPIDLQIAARIREFRTLRGMTQQQLAEQVGISFQQVFKYETGVNRVSCGKLACIARALDVPIGEFFGDLDGTGPTEPPEGTQRHRMLLALNQNFNERLGEREQEAVYQLSCTLAGDRP